MAHLGETLSRVARLDHVVALKMRRIDADDNAVAALSGMKNLQFLDLSRNPDVTDAGAAAHAGLESLRHLDLTSTNV